MNRWTCGAERCSKGYEVSWVTGQNVVTYSKSEDYEMSIHDVRCSGLGKQAPNWPPVIYRMDDNGLQKSCEAGLARAVAPHLGHH